jgi:xanthine/CO dehydrogenase XdhC/CoxF family maturation factor
VIDHRPAFADASRFDKGVVVIEARPEDLGRQVDLADISAVMVMSHNLDHDEVYLGQLLEAAPAYVGVLGPTHRRERLLARLGQGGARVYGPAGLDIGAELPESIALSIMAEIHAVLNSREGRPLASGPA